MRRMRLILTPMLLAFVTLVAFLGCEVKEKEYKAGCNVERINGVVVKIEVTLPYPAGSERFSIVARNRPEADSLVQALETALYDLKAARDQMKVVEPAAPNQVK